MDELPIVERFCVGQNWPFYEDLKKKEIKFTFKPSDKQVEKWKEWGFSKLKNLLIFLKNEYDSLENFDLIIFNQDLPEPFYIQDGNGVTKVYVHIDKYRAYGEEINPEIEKLKISKYSNKIWGEFNKKVPIAFFNKQKPTVLSEELRNSRYKILEEMIKEFEKMDEPQREEWRKALEHSQAGTEIIKKYRELKPESPEIQLKLFIEVIDKLGEKEVEELFKSILKSKISSPFVKNVFKLSLKEQNEIAKNMPEMAKMYDRYKKLKKSLKEFRKKIQTHLESVAKDEKDIHKFLTVNYWLLGIEYFGKIDSDIDSTGKRTGKTNIGRKHADFIIRRLDGLDKCVIIELEEANDKIFNEDGTFSKKVYDGINQAVDYSIENQLRGVYSKGIAVIGSVAAANLSEEQKTRLKLLNEAFHNVDILTYDQIIEKAQATLDFWEKYDSLE